MPGERFLRIHSPEFQAMAARVLRVTELTSLWATPGVDQWAS